MEEELRELILSKGLSQEMLTMLEEGDETLRSLDDLASGATSEPDARSWAEELGLTTRIQKSRFVQSWLEARARQEARLRRQVASTAAAAKAAKAVHSTPAATSTDASAGAGAGSTSRHVSKDGNDSASTQTSSSNSPTVGGSTGEHPGAFMSGSELLPVAAARPHLHQAQPQQQHPQQQLQQPQLAPQVAPVASAGHDQGLDLKGEGYTDWQATPAQPTGSSRRQPALPTRGETETFSTIGGLSQQLRALLRSCGLTSSELGLLESTLEIRTCAELRESIGRWDDAVRLAKTSGINSRVSQENFAAAWRAYADECSSDEEEFPRFQSEAEEIQDEYPLRAHGAPAPHRMLGPVSENLAEAGSRAPYRTAAEKQREVLTKLGAAYGLSPEEALSALDSKPAPALFAPKSTYTSAISTPERAPSNPSESRLESKEIQSPTPPTLDLRTALKLQRRLLEEYRSPNFEAASLSLDKEWQRQVPEPTLEEKMRNIEDLCLRMVLSNVLVEFGFPPDKSGVTQMKAAIGQHLQSCPEARKLQVETSAAVMVGFKL